MNIKVLLVEDSIADATLIQEILTEENIDIELTVVRDGCEAMEFLQASGSYEHSAFRPDLVILDLNMPKKDGRTLLAEMKALPKLKTIPVLILTTSQAEEDIFQGYNLNASCYLVKPLDLTQFTMLVKYIENFWFNSVKYVGATAADA
ncbi:MAG: response regulator [Candidatus Melainabacteria bacterium]|nr:response regulator [Candidatus Melainabacteria bacterium]